MCGGIASENAAIEYEVAILLKKWRRNLFESDSASIMN